MAHPHPDPSASSGHSRNYFIIWYIYYDNNNILFCLGTVSQNVAATHFPLLIIYIYLFVVHRNSAFFYVDVLGVPRVMCDVTAGICKQSLTDGNCFRLKSMVICE
jgi:hypothetical protein